MEYLDINRFLVDSNPHWNAGRIDLRPELGILFRPQFNVLLSQMDKPQILALIGCRRVGKSVIMRQLMHELSSREPVKNICWLSFDEEIVGKYPDILDGLISASLGKADQKDDARVFFFIDEIQFVENWQHILKRYYDRQRNIKFIVSGSSSIFIKEKTTESLAGRIFEFVVPPLGFWEYLILAGKFAGSAKKLAALDIDFEKIDAKKILAAIEEIQIGERHLNSAFDDYLCYGQFPECAGWPQNEAYDYLRNSIYKKTLLYDIPRLYQIRRADDLAFLYSILVRESANLLEINNLARDAGINRNTVSAYLDHLKESLLHFQLTNITSSAREQRRLLKKGYVPSPNFTAAQLKIDPVHPLWRRESGHAAETFVANVLWNRYAEAAHFYRKGDREVDFIISRIPGNLKESVFIEAKYTDSPDRRDLRTLVGLAKENGASSAICLTRDAAKIESMGENQIIYLPMWALKC